MKKSYYPIGGVFFGLMLTAMSIHTKAQTRTISGTVTSSNKPLSGVLIAQEGSEQVTTSGETGIYRLEVTAENTILIFRHPEYAEKKMTVNNQSVININLIPKVQGIEEVVLNAGYYKVRAKENTGSIAKVTSKDIENQPVNNVLSALQGRMAGVNITQFGGTAGGGFDIQIRGRNSLRTSAGGGVDGNLPLYIIDGVPQAGQLTSVNSSSILPLNKINPLNAINPNDIESIEILKDADATAIYGSRGGNGVILVTTKKGKAAPVRLNLTTSQAFSRVGSQLKMMNTSEYLSMRKQAFANMGIATYPANAYDINGTWDQNRYTDWHKELLGGTAENTNIQMSLSGGSERNSFTVSTGYGDQASVFPGAQHYKANTVATGFTHRSADQRFSIGVSNTFAAISNRNLNTDLTRYTNLPPNAPALYTASGTLNWENSTFANPLAQLNASYSNRTKQFNQNLNTSYILFKDLTLKLNAGLTLQDLEEYSLIPHTIYNPSSASGSSSAYSTANRSTSSVFSYVLEPQVSWTKKVGRSEWNVLTGLTYQENTTKSSSISGKGFTSNTLMYNIASATTITTVPFTEIQYRYIAAFARANYQWKNRYILNLTARRDGSSRFGDNNRFANFGAVGAAWILSEEDFLKESKWLSFAKLRGSFGETGSDAIGDFQFTDSYTLAYYSYNGIPGLYPSRLYNPDFSWEKTSKLEAALEMGLFHNRLNFTAAWYRNRSSNQLVGIPLSTVTGFSSILANLPATVENRGFELELSGSPFKSKNFEWSLALNLSVPENKLIAFPGLEGSTYANRYVIGESIYTLKLFNYEGIDPLTGKYTFTDYNKDGKITAPEDAQALRSLEPKYFGGLQNTLRYGNFNLSFLLQFVKQEGYNYFRNMATTGVMLNQPVEMLNVWSPTNPGGIIMPYTTGSDSATNTLTERFINSTAAVSDASYIRLKNVQLNYRIPLAHQNAVVNQATVFVQGQNLLTWTDYFGMDPETVAFGFIPPLRTLSLGVQLTF